MGARRTAKIVALVSVFVAGLAYVTMPKTPDGILEKVWHCHYQKEKSLDQVASEMDRLIEDTPNIVRGRVKTVAVDKRRHRVVGTFETARTLKGEHRVEWNVAISAADGTNVSDFERRHGPDVVIGLVPQGYFSLPEVANMPCSHRLLEAAVAVGPGGNYQSVFLNRLAVKGMDPG